MTWKSVAIIMQTKMLMTISNSSYFFFFTFFLHFSNSFFKFSRHNQIVYKLAEKLKENCSYSLVFMVNTYIFFIINLDNYHFIHKNKINNHKIHPSNKEPAFTLFNFTDQRLKEYQCNLKMDNEIYDSCITSLKEKQFNQIFDFDNHLDDLNADWKNALLNKIISPSESLSAKN
jgi:hypothetical protein